MQKKKVLVWETLATVSGRRAYRGELVSEKLIFQFRESRTQVTKNCQLMREKDKGEA